MIFQIIIAGIALLAFAGAQGKPLNCAKHPIYCKIRSLNPSLSHTFAMELSNQLYKQSRKYGTDPILSVAIAMQESSIVPRDRVARALVGKYLNERYIEVYQDVVTDVGLFQFHVKTIENLGLDKDRLRTDLEYAVEQHVKLLRDKIKMCIKRGVPKDEAFACYHSITPHLRKKYKRLVNRWYNHRR